MSAKFISILGLLVAASLAEKWTVQTDANKTCLIVDAITTASLSTGNGTDNFKFHINGTVAGGVTGDCYSTHGGKPASKMNVEFFPNGETPKEARYAQPWKLELVFTKENETYALADYTLTTAPYPFFEELLEFHKSDKADIDFKSTGANGFKCSKTVLALQNDSSIELGDLKSVAFVNLDKPEFPQNQQYELCTLDSRTSDVVPIVVGACLAGLVIVVLIAYMIGRVRAKRQGYASV